MKSKLVCWVVCLITLLSCQNQEQVNSIQDKRGITISLYKISYEPEISYPKISITCYYPSQRILFGGQGSFVIEEFYPDGKYRIDTKLLNGQFNFKPHFELRVSGIENSESYSVNLSFIPNAESGAIKKSLMIEKVNNTYFLTEL